MYVAASLFSLIDLSKQQCSNEKELSGYFKLQDLCTHNYLKTKSVDSLEVNGASGDGDTQSRYLLVSIYLNS